MDSKYTVVCPRTKAESEAIQKTMNAKGVKWVSGSAVIPALDKKCISIGAAKMTYGSKEWYAGEDAEFVSVESVLGLPE